MTQLFSGGSKLYENNYKTWSTIIFMQKFYCIYLGSVVSRNIQIIKLSWQFPLWIFDFNDCGVCTMYLQRRQILWLMGQDTQIVCVLTHIWCNACDIATPVVSSSTVLQGAQVLKVCSWGGTKNSFTRGDCREWGNNPKSTGNKTISGSWWHAAAHLSTK